MTLAAACSDGWSITTSDRTTLRDLAAQVALLASRPLEQAKAKLWTDHNALRKTRPLIFCDPENGWNEIITQADLRCTGKLARDWEYKLRREIFWGDCMQDDRVVTPYFDIPEQHQDTGWGVEPKWYGREAGRAFSWDPPLKTEADLDRLKVPEILLDPEGTLQLIGLAQHTLGDLLTVRRRTSWWWTLGLTQSLVYLRGLNQMLYDMTDNPKLMHRLMAHLRDSTLRRLDDLERRGLLSANTRGDYVGSGGFGWSDELLQPEHGRSATLDQMWGFAESQETVGVSPRMFAEFVLPYQLPILKRFGLSCYGCCEPLDRRIDMLMRDIPNLRRVSVSPWCNHEVMAEKLGDRYIFSMKPNPSYIAMESFDETTIRSMLRKAIHSTRDCRVEIIMKDCNTIGRDPTRVVRWVQIAREEAEAT